MRCEDEEMKVARGERREQSSKSRTTKDTGRRCLQKRAIYLAAEKQVSSLSLREQASLLEQHC